MEQNVSLVGFNMPLQSANSLTGMGMQLQSAHSLNNNGNGMAVMPSLTPDHIIGSIITDANLVNAQVSDPMAAQVPLNQPIPGVSSFAGVNAAAVPFVPGGGGVVGVTAAAGAASFVPQQLQQIPQHQVLQQPQQPQQMQQPQQHSVMMSQAGQVQMLDNSDVLALLGHAQKAQQRQAQQMIANGLPQQVLIGDVQQAGAVVYQVHQQVSQMEQINASIAHAIAAQGGVVPPAPMPIVSSHSPPPLGSAEDSSVRNRTGSNGNGPLEKQQRRMSNGPLDLDAVTAYSTQRAPEDNKANPHLAYFTPLDANGNATAPLIGGLDASIPEPPVP